MNKVLLLVLLLLCFGFIDFSASANETSRVGLLNNLKFGKSKNEQNPKQIRSKDMVKYNSQIRKQEYLRKQKENEILFLERKLENKKNQLDRLEKSKGD